MRLHAALLFSFFLLPLSSFAATGWNVNYPASKITWAVPFNKQPVTGQFEKWGAKIAFDPAHLETSNLAVTIDLTSVTSQDANRDTTLKGPDFFNTATTPTATFTSGKITKTSQGYVAAGMLTLGGVTKPLALPFTVDINGSKASGQAKVMFSRNAFGIGKGQWKSATEIADMVEVTILITADAAPAK